MKNQKDGRRVFSTRLLNDVVTKMRIAAFTRKITVQKFLESAIKKELRAGKK